MHPAGCVPRRARQPFIGMGWAAVSGDLLPERGHGPHGSLYPLTGGVSSSVATPWIEQGTFRFSGGRSYRLSYAAIAAFDVPRCHLGGRGEAALPCPFTDVSAWDSPGVYVQVRTVGQRTWAPSWTVPLPRLRHLQGGDVASWQQPALRSRDTRNRTWSTAPQTRHATITPYPDR